jgi:hypothetical protein
MMILLLLLTYFLGLPVHWSRVPALSYLRSLNVFYSSNKESDVLVFTDLKMQIFFESHVV